MKLRALIFEDHEMVRSMMTSFLEDRGYEVFAFPEAESCPLYLSKECPCPLEYVCADLIITDIDMPGINGLDFIENQLKYGCKVKNIAVMSGTWTGARTKQAKKLGVHTFQKPWDMEEFCNWLDSCERNIDPERKLSDWFKDKEERENNK